MNTRFLSLLPCDFRESDIMEQQAILDFLVQWTSGTLVTSQGRVLCTPTQHRNKEFRDVKPS